ncbi:MAG: hypothetical protein HLUCCA11_12555 [Phormidesmis priestleyi Ana]|uniref:Uncharacterized protein n=1 Tax=Phormidesmis priestleyi Ana TaxID=1666911 RepID=A0A0N8KMY0_9CYAN|nr:MAG: hypothetical protein HLUCCA11_12555 [Phormidesmis priestleyi Ana]
MTERSNDKDTAESTPSIAPELERLRQRMMRNWWWVCLGLWLTIGALSGWWLRSELQELRAYFTWAAVRYMLYYERLAAVGLGLCVGLTLALLLAESRHILFGLSKGEQQRLTHRLAKIREQGSSHPQWKIIHPDQAGLGK